MARVKQIIGWTAIVLFAATLAGIWVLTEQNAVETSLLSESTARVVEGQATGVQAVDATGEAQAENGMTGGTDSAASNVRSGRLASIRMWVGTNVRRVAHTVEFFFVGLFASVVVVCFPGVRGAYAPVACPYCSFAPPAPLAIRYIRSLFPAGISTLSI